MVFDEKTKKRFGEEKIFVECYPNNLFHQFNILSLFANIGVAEAYLHDLGFNVVLANELEDRRAKLYSQIYPRTEVVTGDITNKKIFDSLVEKSKLLNVNFIMATPPCQGMSTAGVQDENDERNKLILYVIKIVKVLNPQFVFIENVPQFLITEIDYEKDKKPIPNIIEEELGRDYRINKYIIDTKNYSVPQMRQRAIFLLSKKSQKLEWNLPSQDDRILTMKDAIGHLPKLDPFIKDVSDEELLKIFPYFYERKKEALSISRWHIAPQHIKRQVIVMQHTPTGQTAFDNEIYYPIKKDGLPVKGYHNTYKRQNWDKPAYTITMDNRKISSQNNVHPGRIDYINENEEVIYSDARVLTLYEIMKIMSLPDDWNIPNNTSEQFLRRIIGEGIPPMFVKKVFQNLGVK